MNTARAIKHLYPDAVFGVDFLVVSTPQGDEIAVWNLPDPKPSRSDLLTAFAAADAGDKNKAAAKKQRRGVLDSSLAGVVGKDARTLNSGDLRDVIVEVLERLGALDEAYNIRPPHEWRS